MKRTQIYLSEEQHEALRRIAFKQRKSISHVLRDMVDRFCSPNSTDHALSASVQGRQQTPSRKRQKPAAKTPHETSQKSTRPAQPALPIEEAKHAAESLKGLVSEDKYEQLTIALEEYRESLKKLTNCRKNMPS